MGTLQVGGTTLGVKNTSTNKIDLSNAGDVNITGDITKDSLPMYACRAWVNFDGTKDTTGATSTANTNRLIRASGNVTSVLRNGAGDYTVTFTTAMGDNDYACLLSGVNRGSSSATNYSVGYYSTSHIDAVDYDSGSVRIMNHMGSSSTMTDTNTISVAIFR